MKRFLLLFALCTGALAAQEPTMPTGIPSPGWNWYGSVADFYTNQNYYTVWVDNSATNATDTANPNGSPETPRLTIPSLTSLAAGSVVQLRGGPYTGATLYIRASGTSNSPVFIRGDSTNADVSVARSTRIYEGTYLIFENIVWTNGVSLSIRQNAAGEEIHHVVVRDCKDVGTATYGEGNGLGVGDGVATIHDVVFARNTVTNIGDWQSESEDDRHGLSVASNQTNIWYLWNTISHCSGDGFGNGHDANQTTHHLFAGGNHLFECRENGVDLKEVNNVVLSQNYIHGFQYVGSAPGEAVVLHYGPTTGDGPNNIWVVNNVISNAQFGVVANQLTNLFIVGNVIIGIHNQQTADWVPTTAYATGTAIQVNAENAWVVNNTIYDYDKGIQTADLDSQIYVYGNIFSHRAVPDSYDEHTASTSAVWHSDYNLFDSDLPNGTRLTYGSTVRNLAATVTATGNDSHSINGYPVFVADPASLSIGAGSAAIDSNIAQSVYSVFAAAYGASISRDIAGTIRPVGVWDVGAYEFSGPGQSTVGTANVGTLIIRGQ